MSRNPGKQIEKRKGKGGLDGNKFETHSRSGMLAGMGRLTGWKARPGDGTPPLTPIEHTEEPLKPL